MTRVQSGVRNSGGGTPFRVQDPELRRVIEHIASDYIRRDKAQRASQRVETRMPDSKEGADRETRLYRKSNGNIVWIIKIDGTWNEVTSALAEEVTASADTITGDAVSSMNGIIIGDEGDAIVGDEAAQAIGDAVNTANAAANEAANITNLDGGSF